MSNKALWFILEIQDRVIPQDLSRQVGMPSARTQTFITTVRALCGI